MKVHPNLSDSSYCHYCGVQRIRGAAEFFLVLLLPVMLNVSSVSTDIFPIRDLFMYMNTHEKTLTSNCTCATKQVYTSCDWVHLQAMKQNGCQYSTNTMLRHNGAY